MGDTEKFISGCIYYNRNIIKKITVSDYMGKYNLPVEILKPFAEEINKLRTLVPEYNNNRSGIQYSIIDKVL
jgi:hypothetical protein